MTTTTSTKTSRQSKNVNQNSSTTNVPLVVSVEETSTPTVAKAPRRKNTKSKTTNSIDEQQNLTPAIQETTSADEQQQPTTGSTDEQVYVNEVVNVNSVESPIVNDHVEMYAKLNQVISIVSSLKKEFKTMEGKYARELKLAQKQSSKKKKRTGTRSPSGFVKPTRISDELAAFLGKETGCEMARTAVTRELNNYIVLHQLKDAKNGRQINADSKLSTLLKLQEGEVLTFFNLQKYMSPHFPKAAIAPATPVTVA